MVHAGGSGGQRMKLMVIMLQLQVTNSGSLLERSPAGSPAIPNIECMH